jgi:hypothetical protein
MTTSYLSLFFATYVALTINNFTKNGWIINPSVPHHMTCGVPFSTSLHRRQNCDNKTYVMNNHTLDVTRIGDIMVENGQIIKV